MKEKKKLKVNKKTLQNLKLKLKKLSDRKVAPLYELNISNTASC